MANWIFDMFSKKPLTKEAGAASQGTNRDDHFARKLKENDWLAGAMKEADGGEGFDEVGQIMAFEQGELDTADVLKLFSELIKNGHAWTLQGSYGRAAKALIDNGYLSQEGEILKGVEAAAAFRLPMVKIAAYTLGDDMKETIEKDYELAVGGMSDYNIAEMLTELSCDSGETMLEAADALHEKNVEYVKKNRSAAEAKLLKAVGEHTLVDWKEAFKKFRNAEPYKIKEEQLYKDDVSDKKFNTKVPGEKAYDGLSEKEHEKNMEGIGKEEEKGQVGKDASLKTEAAVQDSKGLHLFNCPNCKYEGNDFSAVNMTKLNDPEHTGWVCPKCHKEQGTEKKEALMKADSNCPTCATRMVFDETIPNGKQYCPKCKSTPDATVVDRVEKRPDIAPHIISSASLKVTAYHAGDKAYYHGKPCTIADISLNQYSGEANVEIDVEGESFHLSGKELKELGKEALTPELEHKPEELPIEEPALDLKVEEPKKDDIVMPEAEPLGDEIPSMASKKDVIKKIAEISSPWIVAKDEKGQDVIKRADEDLTDPKDIQK